MNVYFESYFCLHNINENNRNNKVKIINELMQYNNVKKN